MIFDFIAQLRCQGYGEYAVWDDLDKASQERYAKLYCEEHRDQAIEVILDACQDDGQLIEALLGQFLVSQPWKVNYLIDHNLRSDERVQTQFQIDYRDYVLNQKSISGVE